MVLSWAAGITGYALYRNYSNLFNPTTDTFLLLVIGVNHVLAASCPGLTIPALPNALVMPFYKRFYVVTANLPTASSEEGEGNPPMQFKKQPSP